MQKHPLISCIPYIYSHISVLSQFHCSIRISFQGTFFSLFVCRFVFFLRNLSTTKRRSPLLSTSTYGYEMRVFSLLLFFFISLPGPQNVSSLLVDPYHSPELWSPYPFAFRMTDSYCCPVGWFYFSVDFFLFFFLVFGCQILFESEFVSISRFFSYSFCV